MPIATPYSAPRLPTEKENGKPTITITRQVSGNAILLCSAIRRSSTSNPECDKSAIARRNSESVIDDEPTVSFLKYSGCSARTILRSANGSNAIGRSPSNRRSQPFSRTHSCAELSHQGGLAHSRRLMLNGSLERSNTFSLAKLLVVGVKYA